MAAAPPPLEPHAAHLAQVQSIYDARSTQYDSNSVHARQAHDYVSAWTDLKPGDAVLDLACGTGLVALGAKRLVGASGHVVGVDISEGMLEVARRNGEAEGLQVKFMQGDISELRRGDLGVPRTGDDGLFDAITCASALLLLPDPVAALHSWKALLRPLSGRVVTDVQTKDANLVMNIFAAIAPQLLRQGHAVSVPWDASRWKSLADLEQVVLNAGLKIERAFETPPYAVTRYDDATNACGEELFRNAVEKSPMFEGFGRLAVRDQAERLFVQKYLELLGDTGAFVEECRFWVVVASSA